MSWVVWRQHRVQFAAVAALLAAYLSAAVLERTHPQFGGATTSFAAYLPALVGAFWGAPLLARELETGTADVAWTQGVGRGRWLAVKLGVLTGAAALAALALTVGLSAVLPGHGPGGGAVADRFATTYFEAYGTVPVAYAVFGVALGALVGTVVKRTLAAVGATLALFVGVRLAVSLVRVQVLDRPSPGWYWPAQLVESALFLALAAAAVVATARLVSRLG